LKVAAAGGFAAGLGLTARAKTLTDPSAQHDAAAHQHESLAGPLANALVNFGSWNTDPPLDRFPNNSPAAGNWHPVLPAEVTIKAGGAVTFAISGLHQVVVYGDGTRPDDIDENNTIPTTGVPSGVALINDPNNRIYRGPDPSLLPRDRVEAVHFPNPGSYLVICGVFNHFVAGMYALVRVLP